MLKRVLRIKSPKYVKSDGYLCTRIHAISILVLWNIKNLAIIIINDIRIDIMRGKETRKKD